MKRFEYMLDKDIKDKYKKSGIENLTVFLNKLGSNIFKYTNIKKTKTESYRCKKNK